MCLESPTRSFRGMMAKKWKNQGWLMLLAAKPEQGLQPMIPGWREGMYGST